MTAARDDAGRAPASVFKAFLKKEMDSTGGEKYTLEDGPHVFWQDDSTAVVFYYRDGALEQRTFIGGDTIAFQGFAWDSASVYSIPAAPPARQPCLFEGVSRFLAVSDIHGDYEHFREILMSAEVIDSTCNWAWRDGHLVIDGDVFDRGPRVTECLWLIYRLEQEAALSGGRVHFLLGNHELMVIRGDLRYVHERYLEGIAGSTGLHYEDLFGPDTELGRWLRTRPTAIIIDETLFVHAGIAPGSPAEYLPVQAINEIVWSGLDYSTVRLKFSPAVRTLYGSLGPLWYRGFHYEMEDDYPEATREEVETLLDFYNVDRIVVGHTELDSLTALYDGRVLAIDVAVEDLGGQQALLCEDDRLYALHSDGTRQEISGE
ncbi:MAG: metallophosphoesterase, partial [Candidatus Fermentibacteraceae bacterium]|nr:metallophosphoesterase [Candidatus Fermentibacteraceae bacterium]